MNQVMVVHQVQHVFDQNVIVLMKPMKSNRRKTNCFFFMKDIFLFSLQRKNKYHPCQAPAYFDENANDQFHDENQR